MLTRAGRHAPDDSPLKTELHEVCEIAQATLDDIRGLSQTLHPSILDEAGLEETIEWHVANVGRQLGIHVTYARTGAASPVGSAIGIHIYRVLQEALNNVARHSGSHDAQVRLRFRESLIELEIEDHGRGLSAASERRGLGIITMGERAELLGGSLDFLTPPGGGTLVRLRVPLPPPSGHGD
jgi:two-component system sensor histidine kinase UhpB